MSETSKVDVGVRVIGVVKCPVAEPRDDAAVPEWMQRLMQGYF